MKKLTKTKTNNHYKMTAGVFRKQHVDQVEHGLQAMCVKWFRLQYPQLLIYAMTNAAKRSFGLANMLQAEGMVAGMPDLYLAYPSGGIPGLYLEMKTVNGKPSDEQVRIHAYLRSVGYAVEMPRTFEEFQYVVNAYLHP